MGSYVGTEFFFKVDYAVFAELVGNGFRRSKYRPFLAVVVQSFVYFIGVL